MRISPIETQRLIIRQFTIDDWQAAYSYLSDPDVMHYIPDGAMSEERARAFIEAQTGEGAEAFAVVRKDDGALIGHMPFYPWYAPRTFEIGWVFDRRAYGRGYATEAAAALLRYGFVTLRLHRIIATCQPENIASYRVMEKIGMRREAWFRKCLYRDETSWWDEYFYALLEEEWFVDKV